jgi:hypothetical protein
MAVPKATLDALIKHYRKRAAARRSRWNDGERLDQIVRDTLAVLTEFREKNYDAED